MPNFKIWLYGFFSVVALGAFTYIKVLRASNARKTKNIDTLETNIETQTEVHKDDIVREKFNVMQELKVKEIQDESLLDKLEKDRGDAESSDDFTAVTA